MDTMAVPLCVTARWNNCKDGSRWLKNRTCRRQRILFFELYYCFRIKTDMLREIWPNFAAFARVRSRAQSNAHLHLRSRVVRTWLEEGFNYKECAYVFRVHRVCRTSIGLSRGSELRRRRRNLAKFGHVSFDPKTVIQVDKFSTVLFPISKQENSNGSDRPE